MNYVDIIQNDFGQTNGVIGMKTEREKLQRLINQMNDVTETWSVDQMVSHVWQAAKADAVPECEWSEEYDGSIFNTNCGKTFELSNTYSLTENNFKYCFYCGGKIIEAQEQSG